MNEPGNMVKKKKRKNLELKFKKKDTYLPPSHFFLVWELVNQVLKPVFEFSKPASRFSKPVFRFSKTCFQVFKNQFSGFQKPVFRFSKPVFEFQTQQVFENLKPGFENLKTGFENSKTGFRTWFTSSHTRKKWDGGRYLIASKVRTVHVALTPAIFQCWPG